MRLASGTMLDRPWGLTLGTIAQRRLTAQVTVQADDGKSYAIAFASGDVVAATSPLVNDSITRIALTSHVVTTGQVAEITRRRAAAPERDEVDVLAEAVHLAADRAAQLRHRMLVQRAARTFAIDRGTFTIDDEVTLPTAGEGRVALGAAIYHGVRMNLSEQRLSDDLREIGSTFQLRDVTDDELARYEMGEVGPVIASLRRGVTLAELELASYRDIEPRTLHAIVYALVAVDACEASGGRPVERKPATTPPVNVPRTSTPPGARIATDAPLVTRTSSVREAMRTSPGPGIPARAASPTAPPGGRTPTAPRTPSATAAPPPRTVTPTSAPSPRTVTPTSAPSARGSSVTSSPLRAGSASSSPPMRSGASSSPPIPRTITMPRTITGRDRAVAEIQALIAARIAVLEKGGDYFAILGIVPEAPSDAIRAAYFHVARRLHPKALAELGITDGDHAAARVLAQVNAAFQTLSNPERRREYLSLLNRGEATPLAPRARTGDLDKTELAAEAFTRGESALRREHINEALEELGQAVMLAPANVDYAAALAWAQFCAATDKTAVAVETRKVLQRAIDKSAKPIVAHFYLGRVERILGRDAAALLHFQEVLDVQPHNAEAAAEVRFIEARMASGTHNGLRKR